MKTPPNQLIEQIKKLLASPNYRPLRVSEIISTLKIPQNERSEVRRILDRLQHQGIIVRVRKDRLVLPSEANLITGRIEMNERGFGFLIPKIKDPSVPESSADIFIAPEDTGTAMHGDTVVARLHSTPSRFSHSHKRRIQGQEKPRGQVIQILDKANPTIIGVLQRGPQFHYVVPDDPRIGRDIYVNLSRSAHDPTLSPKVGERVVVKLDPWENRHVNPEGTISEIIGKADDPRLDILVIIKKYKLRVEFPETVLSQAELIPEKLTDEDRAHRLDLTQEICTTIDPEDARDHDDALTLKRSSQGHWTVGVHIADVSHYVKIGSPLDREARERGNSVYFPDRVIPMLPERLSNGICSLKENVDRLAKSVLFEINDRGEVLSNTFPDTIFRSAARLSYKQALGVLNSDPHLPTHPQLQNPAIRDHILQLGRLAHQLRKRRFAAGSLDLDFPELKIFCKPNGEPERIERRDSDASHQLVEEFMLLANEAVARQIREHQIPGIYRIHENPDPEKLDEFREMVIAAGFSMGDPNLKEEIQKILKRLGGKPEEYVLKINLLRSLKRAQYSTDPIGHYGLAKDNYTHFTSPIRRYADLIVHRTLARSQSKQRRTHPPTQPGPPTYDVDTLDSMAHHCSITERIADEAEKEATKQKLLEYFERQIKLQQRDSFEALVTEVRNYGLLVELPEFMLNGLVRVSDMEDDFYHFDPSNQILKGKTSQRVLKAGMHLHVQVARIDRFKKLIDFAPYETKRNPSKPSITKQVPRPNKDRRRSQR
jgi:ribonuclease R